MASSDATLIGSETNKSKYSPLYNEISLEYILQKDSDEVIEMESIGLKTLLREDQ